VDLSPIYRLAAKHFRQRRLNWIIREFSNCQDIVDLGGTVESWQSVRFPRTLLVNRAPERQLLPPGFAYLQADACSAGLRERFDLAFSSSTIEHLGTWGRQQIFAGELLRLGRRVYCQTPNRWFPVEPHYLSLFVHWLPARWFGHALHRYATLQGLAQKPSRADSARIRQRESIRLLSKRELRALFPGCQIRTERCLGLAKSFIVWR